MYIYMLSDFKDKKKKEPKYFCREREEFCWEENWHASFWKEDLKVA